MTGAIGGQRARVSLQSPSRADDNLGGGVLSWNNEGDVWADVISGGASRSAAFDGTASTASHVLVIYRRNDVRPGWRALWGARALNIVGVRDEGAPRIDLVCQEEIR